MNNGRFGIHGGQYIPETLMNAVIELEEAYNHYKDDPDFNRELTTLLNEYAGRPSRLYYAKRMTEDLGGAKIYLKREDLNHTGAHKINNVLGQVLLAKKMGKTRVIAETGAGQHGVATATAAALMDMECEVFMGEEDTRTTGSERLPDAPSRSQGPRCLLRYRNPQRRRFRDHERMDQPDLRHPLRLRLRAWAPIPSRPSSVTSSPSSPKRSKSRSWKKKDAFRMLCSPAWAAVPTPSALSITSFPDPEVRLIGL